MGTIYSKQAVRGLVDALPAGYKTRDLDRLIARLVKEKADVSELRPYILTEQDLHRLYFYVTLKQIKRPEQRMAFIHQNLLFSDWWHTDQLINFVADLPFETALSYARDYVASRDPFVRRWGYVLFISRLGRDHGETLLPLIKDDGAYYVQMAQAWLIAELAIREPYRVHDWMRTNGLQYNVNGKAIQKICDSYRISDEWKKEVKALRNEIKSPQKQEIRP